mmetsp:Transcript_11975/g.25343  ORF Transcript_11975/g.25343 Transcript_11975/m.25343 type:complete len:249 (-) Transcript_11975:95-841(-)
MRIHRLAPTAAAAAVLLALAATANVMSGAAEDGHPDNWQQQEPVSKTHTRNMIRQRKLSFPQHEEQGHRATQDPNEVMVYAAVLDDDELNAELAKEDAAVERAAQSPPEGQSTKKDLISPELKSTTIKALAHSSELAHGQLDGVLPGYADTQAFKSIEEHEKALIRKRQELRDKRKEMLSEKGKVVEAKDELEGLEAELAEVEGLLGIAADELTPNRKKRWFKRGKRRRWRRYRKKIAGRRKGGNGIN